MTQPDWDDERLDAAFHARFDRPAPDALAHDVHVRIAGTSPTRVGAPRIGQPWSLAAAAVVIVLVGAAMFVPAAFSLPGASARPSALPSVAATSAPGASATPTEQALPGSLFDGRLPIVRVSDAIAVRDAGVDDREMAVKGWFQESIATCPAPIVSPISPLQFRCPNESVWLMEEAESLVHRSGDQTNMSGPRGPALKPDLDGITWPWQQERVDANGDSVPFDVVFVGHFDDRRAELCPKDEIDACRDRFVVDSVARVRGVEPPLSVTREVQSAVSIDHEIARIVATEAPDSTILSAIVVDGSTELPAIEPSLSTGQQGLIDQPVLWVVRVLESERISTYIVIDGSDAIYEMNQAGEAILVGGTPPTPGASSSTTPSASPSQGLGYNLVCGPLGPDTCQAKAAGVIADASEKQVVSIAFSDQCGSYSVTFDDGDSITAEIDCIPGASPN